MQQKLFTQSRKEEMLELTSFGIAGAFLNCHLYSFCLYVLFCFRLLRPVKWLNVVLGKMQCLNLLDVRSADKNAN